ncbi:MAG TPA: hypothetical protein VFB50_00440, partial [Chloroflexota bacterium]|nr:hypothetical protein [Chloroflexota bacterium]
WMRRQRRIPGQAPAHVRGTSWRRQLDVGRRGIITLIVDSGPLQFAVFIAFLWRKQQQPILLDEFHQ